MNVNSFILLGASEISGLVTLFKSDLDAWSGQWLPEHSDVYVECALNPNPEIDLKNISDGYLYSSGDSEQWIAFTASEDVLLTLSSLLLAEEAPRYLDSGTSNQIITGVAHEALCALMDSWLAIESVTTDMTVERQLSVCEQLVACARQPGEGVQQFTLSIGESEVAFFVPNRALLSRIQRRPELSQTTLDMSSVESALANQLVQLRAMLGELELTLGALGNLKPGDIVRLDKPIVAPLSVFINDSTEGFTGFLGQRNENLAFRVNAQIET